MPITMQFFYWRMTRLIAAGILPERAG